MSILLNMAGILRINRGGGGGGGGVSRLFLRARDPWRVLSIYVYESDERSHHHHQVPDLEQTLATMPLQTSLSSDNFKKKKREE